MHIESTTGGRQFHRTAPAVVVEVNPLPFRTVQRLLDQHGHGLAPDGALVQARFVDGHGGGTAMITRPIGIARRSPRPQHHDVLGRESPSLQHFPVIATGADRLRVLITAVPDHGLLTDLLWDRAKQFANESALGIVKREGHIAVPGQRILHRLRHRRPEARVPRARCTRTQHQSQNAQRRRSKKRNESMVTHGSTP